MDQESPRDFARAVREALTATAQGQANALLGSSTLERMERLKAEGFTTFAITALLERLLMRLAEEGAERSLRYHFEAIFERMFAWMIQLRDIEEGSGRARVVHHLLDAAMQRSEGKSSEAVSCCRGCSFCCHTPVGLTRSEESLIRESVEANAMSWDKGRALGQSQVQNLGDYQKQLSWPESACVLLSEEGDCRIYADRPVSCRKVLVVSEATLCDPRVPNDPSYLLNLEAEIIVSAFYNLERSDGVELRRLSELMLEVD